MNFSIVANLGHASILFMECLKHYAKILRRREQLDLSEFNIALSNTGLSVILQLTVISILVGSIISLRVSSLLESSSLSTLFIESLTSIIFLEFSPLLVGILVASRAAVYLSVRIGAMSINNEIAGLLVCNINPVHFIVAPTLLAMIFISFAFVLWADIIVILSNAFFLWLKNDISFIFYLQTIYQYLSIELIIINISKPLLFVTASVVIAATYGYLNHRQAETIATSASSTMTLSFAVILFIDVLYLLI